MKKILSLMLALLMLVSVLVVPVYAGADDGFNDGQFGACRVFRSISSLRFHRESDFVHSNSTCIFEITYCKGRLFVLLSLLL